MEKIKLTREKETLLIPLYCRAMESRKEAPIISDKKALEIIERTDYNFAELDVPRQTHGTLCMRAKQFDEYVKRELDAQPETTVIQLGCGLDSRFYRVDNGRLQWYDLDFPEVIQLKKEFFRETGRYQFIPSSVMGFDWLKKVEEGNRPVVILAEGLFMYLQENEVKTLFSALMARFPGSILIFDAFSRLTARGIKNHPSLKRTGAVIGWGIDDAGEIEKWEEGIHLLEEWYFPQSGERAKLGFGFRIAFMAANLFPVAKKAHRILVFRLGKRG